jgi:IclR family transcriptional regulator, acetate operon repressor
VDVDREGWQGFGRVRVRMIAVPIRGIAVMKKTAIAQPLSKTSAAVSAGEGTGSLEKALDVLDTVGSSSQGLSQSEIAERLAIPRTTVYRLLATLVARGLLRRDAQRRVYCLGFKCFELARQAYVNPDLVAAASTELRSLRDLTGETTYLATLDGHEVVALERFDGAHSERSASSLGERKPLHCTSQGKAILAALPLEQRERLIKELPLKAVTPGTITDRRRLASEIKLTAARGWSIDEEEIVPNVRCAGAAIVDAQGVVRGAISVAGPAWRITRERVQHIGPEVAEAARRIGAQLRQTISVDADQAVQALATGPASTAFHGAYARQLRSPAVRSKKASAAVLNSLIVWADTLAPALYLWDGKDTRPLATLESPIHGLVAWQQELPAKSAFQTSCAVVALARQAFWVSEKGQLSPVAHWPDQQLQAMCSEPGDAPDAQLWLALSAGIGEGSEIVSWRPGGVREMHWRLQENVGSIYWHAGQLIVATASSGSLMIFTPGQKHARRLASLPRSSGQLSGLAVDDEGGIWTALAGGWGVVCINADGHLDRVVGLPVPYPTDVLFERSESGRAHLILTSARQSVALDVLSKAPLSGQLLRVPIDR